MHHKNWTIVHAENLDLVMPIYNLIELPQADNAANGIPKNAAIVVPLKCLGIFWRSLKMLAINYKAKLKLRWTKHCDLSGAVTDYSNGNNDDNNVF